MAKQYMNAGDRAVIEIGYSEATAHMGVAGQVLEVELRISGMAQIYRNGREYSFPVTAGEAGFYFDGMTGGYYCYPIAPDAKEVAR